jgi:hypothetical protein
MRLYHVRVESGSHDPLPSRTWLIIAQSEREARNMAPRPPEVDATIEAVRDLPAQGNRRRGVIGWMGDGPGAAF